MFLATGSPVINSWIANDQQIHGFFPIRYLMSLECFFAQNIECHAADTGLSALKQFHIAINKSIAYYIIR